MPRSIAIPTVFLLLAVSAAVYYFFFVVPAGKSASIGTVLDENGFAELKPPSRLVPPGIWVSVAGTDPMHLNIICPRDSALGLTDDSRLQNSTSANASFVSKLKATFGMEVGAFSSLKADPKFGAVENIAFKLSNVSLIEIADDVVFSSIADRKQHCRDAIKFRLDSGDVVSMVKSALVADVTYDVTFAHSVSGAAKAELQSLALSLGAKLEGESGGERSIVGQNLIWGIRDDVKLAKVGFQLPSVGGDEKNRSVLTGRGPITKVATDKQARRSFPDKTALVSHDVKPLKQSKTMGCWATVYTMLKSWRDKKDWTVPAALETLGSDYVVLFQSNEGLPGGHERSFVTAAGMTAKPPANYMLTAFISMLRDHGPLWIVTGDGISSHARLLTAIHGTSEEESRSAYASAVFEFIDPLVGDYRYEAALTFMAEFEREAAFVVQNRLDDLALRWQILHWL